MITTSICTYLTLSFLEPIFRQPTLNNDLMVYPITKEQQKGWSNHKPIKEIREIDYIDS